MDNEKKRRIAYEVLILLGVLVLLTFITRIWPVLLLALVGVIICAMRLLFLKVKTVEPVEPVPPPQPPPPETELSLVRKAFGLLQCRISEWVELQYPGARWVWGIPNAIERFRLSEPLIILLNGAGGYQKAQVFVCNLLFKGLRFLTLESQPENTDSAESLELEQPDDAADDDPQDDLPEDVPVNYGRLAFEWVDANMAGLDARYNESIAQNQTDMLIPSEDLPHPDSWPDVCDELTRNGFTEAVICEGGITVNITQ